jgi:hypothetical protein
MISELSVTVPNRPNQMAKVLKILSEGNVNLLGFTIQPSGEYSVIRMICHPLDKAKEQLNKYAYSFLQNKVFAICIPQEPGKLFRITQLFGENEINIEYGYLTLRSCTNEAVVFLGISTDQNVDATWLERAEKIIREQNFRDLNDQDIAVIYQG